MSTERKRTERDECRLYSGAHKQPTLLICHRLYDAAAKLRSMRQKLQLQRTRIFDQNRLTKGFKALYSDFVKINK